MAAGSGERVVLGMSGGVDSSAAAALLLEQGCEVIGITLKLWPQDCLSRADDKCCGPQAVADARAVCHRLGIPFYLVDESEEFQRRVVGSFAQEYRAGRTPNPCVLCNQHLKFGTLIRRAQQLGASRVATGHYARTWRREDGRVLLLRGRDERKDQSYFLFSLQQEQLAWALFPLGDLDKQQARGVAREAKLKTAAKVESMEICFVPDQDYGGFLRKSGLVSPQPGEIVDREGRVRGRHEGVAFYTIGQRRGLRISARRPLYVVGLDAAKNQVVVGEDGDLMKSVFRVERCNWISEESPRGTIEAMARIRYNHPGTAAEVTIEPDSRAWVRLKVPQRAITPGQACVFYQGDVVVGGGWIQGLVIGNQ